MRLCKNCEFFRFYKHRGFCALHEKKVNAQLECQGEQHAGVGIFRKFFPPWHAIQYAAKRHDVMYEESRCASTKLIDKCFLNNYEGFVKHHYRDHILKKHLRIAKRCYRIIRTYGIMRYMLCRVKGKDTLC